MRAMKPTLTLLTILLLAAALTFAAAKDKGHGKATQAPASAAVEVLHWKDGRAAALMLMFDDNLDSQRRNAVPELEKRRMQATFYFNPGKNGFAKNQFWQVELPKLGHEYAAHTMTHKVAEESKADAEISESAAILRKLHPPTATSPLMSFARPGGKGAFEVSRPVEAELLKKHQLISRDSGGLLMYVGEPPDALEKWLDGLIKKMGDGKICFHGVGGDYISVKMEVFTAFLDAIEKRREQFWVAGHIRVHKYATEFASAKVTVTESGERKLTLRLTSDADPALYDESLTLRARIPADWKSCAVTQAGTKTTIVVQNGTAQFDATPGANLITLEKQ
jgi:hypothetical protein